MLKKLTDRLVKEENKALDKELLVEGSIVPTKFSTIERYASVNPNDCTEDSVEELAKILYNTKLTDDMTEDEQKEELINAVKNSALILTEGVEFKKDTNTITMDKDSYVKFKETITAYKENNDENLKKDFKKFIKDIKQNVSKVDEDIPADAFITALINSLYKIFVDKTIKINSNESTKTNFINKINELTKAI